MDLPQLGGGGIHGPPGSSSAYIANEDREDFITTNISISSDPVKVYPCIINEPDCFHEARVKIKNV